MVIITAGMIGVGKTTLTDLIAKHLGTQAFFEPVGENPVLPLYYARSIGAKPGFRQLAQRMLASPNALQSNQSMSSYQHQSYLP